MRYLKVINLIIFILFFFFIINFYFSENFLQIKNNNRKNFSIYLDNEINKIKVINTKKDFKEFQDNSKYFKKNTEEKKFWQLLKTK